LHSRLDDIPGVGRKRKASLLKQLKSFKKIRDATIDELAGIPGMNRKVATAIKTMLAD